MKPLLNTLFVTTQGAYLSREGLTVAVSVDEETRVRVPIHTSTASFASASYRAARSCCNSQPSMA
jgi:hypothetical protein